MKTLYVGNLPGDSSEADVRALFTSLGAVHAVTMIKDRRTGQLRGFGFVDMDDQAAQRAIATLNHKRMGDRQLMVNETHGRTWHQPRRIRYRTTPPSTD